MNIAILGATGNFGIALTSKLLAYTDHNLTLISRNAGNKFEDNYRCYFRRLHTGHCRQHHKLPSKKTNIYGNCRNLQ